MKKIRKAILVLGLAASTMHAAPSLDVNVLVDAQKAEQNVVRLNGFSSLPGNATTNGVVDFTKEGSFYSEVGIAKSLLGKVGIKGEWNGAPGFNQFWLGPNATFSGKHGFLDVKAYPFAYSFDKVQQKGQVGMFGKLLLPKDVSLENWTDVNMDYVNGRVSAQSELSLIKKLVGGVSVLGHVQYNVVVPDGFNARAGVRYDF